MQRDAVAALVDRRYHLGRRRPAEYCAGHGRGLVRPQARQTDLLGQPLAQQAGPQLTHGPRRVELVASVGADDQHRPRRQAAGQMAEHIQAQLVGPVQILQDDQRRSARIRGNQQVSQVLHQQAAPVMGVTGVGGDRAHP